jgi:Ca2+/Na+ antiporter
VAGCTLLAVGNGAPDIFTAHAAMQGQEDLPLLLSALLGAALLTLTAVLASVLLVNKVPHAQLPKLAPQGRTAVCACAVSSLLPPVGCLLRVVCGRSRCMGCVVCHCFVTWACTCAS